MELWGPFSEEEVNQDFQSAIDFLGESWLNSEANKDSESASDLAYYFKSASKVINEGIGIESESVDKEAAVRFLEFGSYVRTLSESEIIDIDGNQVQKSLSDLYQREIRTTDQPNNYINELRTAGLYTSEGHEIAFIDEHASSEKTPEFRIMDISPVVDIECKRPKPKEISNGSSENIESKIADVLAGVSGKLDDSRPGVVHIAIPSEIRLSKSQRIQLRHEIKGEIVERSPKINAIILQQIGLKEEDGSPRSIIGVRGPHGDTTVVEISLSLVPHYYELPDDFTLLGMDANSASNAHQTMDEKMDEDLSTDPDGLPKGLDLPEWSFQCIIETEALFADESTIIPSDSGKRGLVLGGTNGPRGYIEYTDVEVGMFQIVLPEKLKNLRRCHMYVVYGDEEFTVSIIPVYPGSDIGRIRETEKGPTLRF